MDQGEILKGSGVGGVITEGRGRAVGLEVKWNRRDAVFIQGGVGRHVLGGGRGGSSGRMGQ